MGFGLKTFDVKHDAAFFSQPFAALACHDYLLEKLTVFNFQR